MNIPAVTFTNPVLPVEKELTVNAVAQAAGAHPKLVRKWRDAGLLMDFTPSQVRPFVEAATVSAERTLPIIQTDAASPAGPDTSAKPLVRNFYGESPSLSNDDWKDAQRGDWTGVSGAELLDGRFLLVGLGGVITGVTRVSGVDEASDPRKVRLHLEILGRVTSSLAEGQMYLNPNEDSEEVEFARSLLGKRYAPQRGGSITRI
ncbi:hypothetical protein ACX80N_12655 [Arthrobacter sp. MDT2-16]